MDLGTSLTCFRWLVAAGWSLLLCDCWLVTFLEKLFEPQEGLWRALGALWDGPGRARAGARIAYEAHGRCWAAHGPFELKFSNVFGPSDALSLRFPMFCGHRTLWAYFFQCFATGRSELTFSNALRPPDALSLRFPILWGPRTLSPYACAAKSPKAKLRINPC